MNMIHFWSPITTIFTNQIVLKKIAVTKQDESYSFY